MFIGARSREFQQAITPILPVLKQEIEVWDFSCEVLGRAGWLPHYTTPFDDLVKHGMDIETVQNVLAGYYDRNWQNVRSRIEIQLLDHKIDAEAKATFREAMDAHEAGLYRCVCRVLFPEIERVLRKEISNNPIGRMSFNKMIKNLTAGRSIHTFTPAAIYELQMARHLTKMRRTNEKDISDNDRRIFGLFQSAFTEEDRNRLIEDPIPNRNAAVHGLVVYSSPQNSLNMIFATEYVFRVISSLKDLQQREVDGS